MSSKLRLVQLESKTPNKAIFQVHFDKVDPIAPKIAIEVKIHPITESLARFSPVFANNEQPSPVNPIMKVLGVQQAHDHSSATKVLSNVKNALIQQGMKYTEEETYDSKDSLSHGGYQVIATGLNLVVDYSKKALADVEKIIADCGAILDKSAHSVKTAAPAVKDLLTPKHTGSESNPSVPRLSL